MKFLIVDTYNLDFQRHFCAAHPDAPHRPYDEQWRILMDQCFGTSDFYSSNLIKLGHEATEVVANYEPLQRQWARERGLDVAENKPVWTIRMRKGFIPWPKRIQSREWFYFVLRTQVKHYRPDVLYIQNMNGIAPDFLHEIRPYVRLIIGQIAYPISRGADFREYDLILTSFPHFVEKFRQGGLASEYFKLGFESRILGQLQRKEHHSQVVFIGGLSPFHTERIRFLKIVATRYPLYVYADTTNLFDKKSLLGTRHCGSTWGLDMYNALYNSDIALNHHINVAENYANNMRLYETTGVGAFLITDYKDNLHTFFDLGTEVIAYRSPEECAELISYYLEHEAERKTIARSGQSRTLAEHTYYHRMQELIEIVRPLLHQRAPRLRNKTWQAKYPTNIAS